MLVILASWVTEIGKIVLEDQLEQIVSEASSPK
jgi:hypothetical protein